MNLNSHICPNFRPHPCFGTPTSFPQKKPGNLGRWPPGAATPVSGRHFGGSWANWTLKKSRLPKRTFMATPKLIWIFMKFRVWTRSACFQLKFKRLVFWGKRFVSKPGFWLAWKGGRRKQTNEKGLFPEKKQMFWEGGQTLVSGSGNKGLG